jgi:hypothetical protein
VSSTDVNTNVPGAVVAASASVLGVFAELSAHKLSGWWRDVSTAMGQLWRAGGGKMRVLEHEAGTA